MTFPTECSTHKVPLAYDPRGKCWFCLECERITMLPAVGHIEKILFRRALENRLDGYTRETAQEIAHAVATQSSPAQQLQTGGKEGDGERTECQCSRGDVAKTYCPIHGPVSW